MEDGESSKLDNRMDPYKHYYSYCFSAYLFLPVPASHHICSRKATIGFKESKGAGCGMRDKAKSSNGGRCPSLHVCNCRRAPTASISSSKVVYPQ